MFYRELFYFLAITETLRTNILYSTFQWMSSFFFFLKIIVQGTSGPRIGVGSSYCFLSLFPNSLCQFSATTKYHRLSGLKTESYALTVLETKSQMEVSAGLFLLEASFSLMYRWLSSLLSRYCLPLWASVT